MSNAFADIIQFLLDARGIVAVIIAIVGSMLAGFIFLKSKNAGGGLKPAVTMAAGTLVAVLIVVMLPNIAGQSADIGNKAVGNNLTQTDNELKNGISTN
jgi:hypothetical protein